MKETCEREGVSKAEKQDSQCQQIMEQLLRKGFSYQVNTKEIENAIIRCGLGRDERTWKRWIRTLEVMEYIKESNCNVYEMNVTKVPNLFQVLKNIPQTHIG